MITNENSVVDEQNVDNATNTQPEVAPANIDEAILLSKKVDTASSQPVISQVLRIAIYDEFKAYETYTKVLETFGYDQLFSNIKDAEAVHYAALIPLAQKYNVEVPINDWIEPGKIVLPNTLLECYELGVAGEINNIRMYDELIAFTNENDVKDVLYKLQAASYNNHLPAFRNAVANVNNVNNNPMQAMSQENIMDKIGEYQMLMNDIASGNMDQDKLTQLLSKLNISSISGAVMGGALVAFLNNYTQNKDKE